MYTKKKMCKWKQKKKENGDNKLHAIVYSTVDITTTASPATASPAIAAIDTQLVNGLGKNDLNKYIFCLHSIERKCIRSPF